MSTANNVINAMQAYGIKQKSANNYNSNSPLRANSDSMSFVLKIEDDEHGTYYDHVAEQGGSLYQLAEILGIDTPKASVQNTKRAYDSPEDYARSHGITWEQLQSAGWQSVTHHKRPALLFNTLSGGRYRFLDGQSPV